VIADQRLASAAASPNVNFSTAVLLAKPDYSPFFVPIKGTNKRRLPNWMAEMGFDREALTALTRHFHMEFRGRALNELSRFRLGINSQELTHNQRNRFWQELSVWQALLKQELADQDRRNDAYAYKDSSVG